MQYRVYYEDTDCGGVVYHSNYLKFCERARSDLFFQKGLNPHSDESFFVVTNIEASFLSGAKIGDMLQVETNIIQKKKASIVLEQIIYKDDKKIYTQNIKLAYLKNGKPSAIPQKDLNILEG